MQRRLDSKGSSSSAVLGEHTLRLGDLKLDREGLHFDHTQSFMAAGAADGGSSVRFEDLEVQRTLGSGVSATVKLVKHLPTGRYFALKQLPLHSKAMRHMVLEECRALWLSDCDTLVSFAGALYIDGSVALLLEYMDCGSLHDVVLRQGPLPEPVLAGIAYQLFWACGYLEAERRVHRDLKPENVLLATDGSCKVSDFGVSRALSTAVVAQTQIGSFAYFSPERMQSEEYSFASDIWSAGLILLYSALGKYPYPGCNSHIEFVEAICYQDAPVPTEPVMYQDREIVLSPAFLDLISQCLDKSPGKRPSAAEVLDADWFILQGVSSLDVARDRVADFLC